jgi:hypothetical protein
MRTLGESIKIYRIAWVKLGDMIEKDDKSDIERTRRLKLAYEKIDGGLDGLEGIGEWD